MVAWLQHLNHLAIRDDIETDSAIVYFDLTAALV